MGRAISTIPLDRSGVSPNSLVVSEKCELNEAPFNYSIVKLEHGGFYEHNLKVYDYNHRLLIRNYDYFLGYYHKTRSLSYGRDIFSAIIITNPDIKNYVYVTAQMVGSDAAFSFTVVEDYYLFLSNLEVAGEDGKDIGDKDYIGFEPCYAPGELAKRRWQLDTYQPFNNEIYALSRAISGHFDNIEEEYRQYIRDSFDRFVGEIDGLMTDHIGNLNNPHNNTKEAFGFKDLNNYRVATLEEVLEGTRNDLYLTPELTWKYLEHYSFDDLSDHLEDFNNPHGTTAADVHAVSKEIVNQSYDKKYFVDEVVENSTRGFYKADKTYSQMLTEFRSNIPATNFTTGKLALQRMGSGSPTSSNVLVTNSQRWTDWTTFIQGYIADPGDVFNSAPGRQLDFNQGFTEIQGSRWRNTANLSFVCFNAIVRGYSLGGWVSGGNNKFGDVSIDITLPFGLFKENGRWTDNIGA